MREYSAGEWISIDFRHGELAVERAETNGLLGARDVSRPAVVVFSAHHLDLTPVMGNEDDLLHGRVQLVVAELFTTVVVLSRWAQDFDDHARIEHRVLLRIVRVELERAAHDAPIRVRGESRRLHTQP